MILRRLLVAAGIGILAGWLVYALYSGLPWARSDWDQLWMAGRAFLGGQDPYQALTPADSPWPLLYPLPAVLLALPFTAFPLDFARSVWFAVSAGALAYAWTDRPAWRLTGFLSGAFYWAAVGAQWTPLLLASLWVPVLGVCLVAKPTTGLALIVRRPSWVPVIGGLVLLAISFLVWPSWAGSWRHAVQQVYHQPAILRFGGILMLAALVRWRRPEARMLAALALIPQAAMPYDLLLLFAVARTKIEWAAVVVLTNGVVAWALHVAPGIARDDTAAFAEAIWPAMLLLGYLPAVVMVLRRPNRSEDADGALVGS